MEEESKQVLELAKHSWLIGFFFLRASGSEKPVGHMGDLWTCAGAVGSEKGM